MDRLQTTTWRRAIRRLSLRRADTIATWCILVFAVVSMAAIGSQIVDAVHWRDHVGEAHAALRRNGGDDGNRREAVIVLLRNCRDSVETLRRALRDHDPEIRRHAENALADIAEVAGERR